MITIPVCLNLDIFIPLKDVRKIIWKYLNRYDRLMVKCAHNMKNLDKLIDKYDLNLLSYLITFEYNEIIDWLEEKKILMMSEFIIHNSARQGNFIIMEYIMENHPEYLDIETCAYAADGNQRQMMIYLRLNDCPWDEDTARRAKRNGSPDLRKWLCENDCPGADSYNLEGNSCMYYDYDDY